MAGAALLATTTRGSERVDPLGIVLALLPIGLAAGIGPLISYRGVAMVLWLDFGSLTASYRLFGRGIAGVAVATATTLSLAEPLTAAAGAALAGIALVCRWSGGAGRHRAPDPAPHAATQSVRMPPCWG